MINMRTELKPVYDIRKSFYKKAHVLSYGKFIALESYESIIAIINENGTAELTEYWDYSATTIRHLSEFLRQHGFKPSEVGKPTIKKALERGTFTKITELTAKNKMFNADIDTVRELTAIA